MPTPACLEVKREQLDLARKAGCNEITNGAKISSLRRWEMTKVNMSEVKVSFQFTLTIHTIKEDGPDDFSESGEGDMQVNGWNTNINNLNIAHRTIQLILKRLSPHTSNLPSFDCCVFFCLTHVLSKTNQRTRLSAGPKPSNALRSCLTGNRAHPDDQVGSRQRLFSPSVS